MSRRALQPLLRATSIALLTLLAAASCARGDAARDAEGRVRLVFSGSSLGAEGELLGRQLARFEEENPGIAVELRRTPDDASQRHQLFVQWLNARMGEPDVLQLDVVWTAEFAAAGWIRALDGEAANLSGFARAAADASRWRGRVHARPWFVDVGLLYRRTDLVPDEPATLAELSAEAHRAGRAGGPRYGLVLQAARYEGLMTGFLELLAAHGGRILDDSGAVVINDPAAVAALTSFRELMRAGVIPREALTWHEEETRFAFQNGEAVFMRNWPYAAALLADTATSRVAGRFAVGPMPATVAGRPASTLGGALLAVNAHSAHAVEAQQLLVFLTAPQQMRERAAALGQWPARETLFGDAAVRDALGVDSDAARRSIANAVARPVTPVYTQLSEIVQIAVHRTLAGQAEPRPALERAAREIRELLEGSGLTPDETRAP